ncbi:hypothetical protein LX87_04276 [Larkinella arboricola]|uniref:Uncharacterized protein n=1 Tax=Larkinella arboricola TaxID=643671 RepID=A0A327WQX3_LARAB|nr:hypothetical protein [Larkinella arboricola]RAJ94389.1 hypothetical protein LX87_04276 [Larkinella arboricola]
MKPLTIVLGFLFLLQQSGFSQRWTVQRVSQQLPFLTKFQVIPTGDSRYYLTVVLDTLPPNHVLAEIYTPQNAIYWSYVLSRYSTLAPPITAPREFHLSTLTPVQQSTFLKDTLNTLNTVLHQALQKDSVLNRHFLTMTTYYLQAKGTDVEGYTVPPKITVTMPELMQTTARFFEWIKASDGQHIQWQIKPGNDRSEVSNRPLLEAFCSQVVWKLTVSLAWTTAPHDTAFVNELRSLENRLAPLPDSPENRLIIRQSMQDLIARNALLEKELRKEYERLTPWLGFVLAH